MGIDDKPAPKIGFVRKLFGRDRPAQTLPPVIDRLYSDTEISAEGNSLARPGLSVDTGVAVPGMNENKPASQGGWWSRLRLGLTRSSSALGSGISELFSKRKMDPSTLDEFEDMLIQSDLGAVISARIVGALRKGRYERGIDEETAKNVLAAEVEKVLTPVALPLLVPRSVKPFVILVIGVNGSGKTTTIGKLAARFSTEGKKVLLAACDTFRAAATEQLRIWASRTGATLIAREQGADASGLAYDAMISARSSATDVLIIDTAGRLQNRQELMAELEKIIRVIKKADASAPHSVLLVLDATVGQNALGQVAAFQRTAGVTGLVMTKLDGTARGGILIAIAEQFKIPVHYIGVGEGVDDMQSFTAKSFARAIAGLENEAEV